MTTFRSSRRRTQRNQAGFSLLEALIAMLVVSFGLLGIGAFHYTLSRASDLAKQRNEATHIANKEIEKLRSFYQRAEDGAAGDANVTYADDVSTQAAYAVTVVTTNTTFNLSRAVTTPPGDKFRWISVLVTWTDRTNQTQEVRLASAISDGDPSDLGVLGTTRGLSSTLRPKNRNINIPYPAVNLAGGVNSAFVPPPGNVAYVFSNATGNILRACEPTVYNLSSITGIANNVSADAGTALPFAVGDQVTVAGLTDSRFNGTFTVTVASGTNFTYTPASAFPATPGVTQSGAGTVARVATLRENMTLNAASGYTCTDFTVEAYLLSGYIRFYGGSSDNFINTTGATQPLNATTPFTFAYSNSAGTRPLPAATACYAERQRVVQAPNVDPENVTSLVRSGNIVTVTTQGNHGYTPGMVVNIINTSNYLFHGQFEVLSASGNVLTYYQFGADASASGNPSNTVRELELVQQLTLAESATVPSGYNQTISRFISYACIVTPTSVAGGRAEWWGMVRLQTNGSWNIGPGSDDYRVCRYSADYDGNGRLSNAEHPSIYRQVTSTLDNQNYVLIRGNADCPSDVAPDYSGSQAGDLVNTNTFSQQPSTTLSTGEPAANDNTPLDLE